MTGTEGALTLVTPIESDRLSALRVLLERMGEDPAGNSLVPFAEVSATHFARWAIIPAGESGRGESLPAQLLLSVSFDLPLDAYLDRLMHVAAPGLHKIYGHCCGYPAGRADSPAALRSYLLKHAVPEQVFYPGTPGLTVAEIRRQNELRERIEAFLDQRDHETRGWEGCSAAEVRAEIQQFVRGEDDLQWAQEAPPRTPRTLRWYGWVALAVLAILLSPVLLLWTLLIRLHELRRGAPTPPPRSSAAPDRPGQIQNYLTHVAVIEPGFLRAATLRAVLWLVNFAGRRIFNQGALIGLSTLHFVRWVMIDNGKRLLFVTNYDGSMSGYVSDFINRSWQIPSALTAIWTNTRGFPRARWLIFGGARELPEFSAFLGKLRVATQVWYAAYPWLTCANIMNNLRIRADLFTDLDEREVAAWLRRF